jgi:FHA domain
MSDNLDRMLAGHRAAVSPHPSADHPDVDTLARHVAGQLSTPKARDVAAHLLACDDGRCVAFVRGQSEDVDGTGGVLYPSENAPARPRTFQCKQGLWDQFGQISQEIGVPLDALVEEAMTDYARSRGALDAPTDPQKLPEGLPSDEETRDAPHAILAASRIKQAQSGTAGRIATPPPGTVRMPNRPARPPQPVSAARAAALPPPPRSAGGAPATKLSAPLAAPLGRSMSPVAPPAFAAPPAPPARGASASIRSMPPPLPPAGPAMSAPMPPMSTMKSARTAAPVLTLAYQGRSYTVDKDRYMIGRSKTAADLRLDDANVSRQHAMIERMGGAYFIVDLGSTNGIFVSGERVARRALRDGDVIEITSHTISATLV